MNTSTQFTIQNRTIGDGHPAFIIAEIGINHDGKIDQAHQMIDAAHKAGADAVKFQTVDAAASYVKGTESYEIFIDKQLSKDDYSHLITHCDTLGIICFTTCADFPSLELCQSLQMPAYKISSGLMTNTALIQRIIQLNVPVIISTGMAYLDEIKTITGLFEERNKQDYAVLQCVSIYPTPAENANIKAMHELKQHLSCPVGYSNHCLHPLTNIVAVAAGANVIEQHFTLDKTMQGADHHLSSEPGEFYTMVQQIRLCESMLGSGKKYPLPEEIKKRDKMHRRVTAAQNIKAGELFTIHNISLKRSNNPGGLPPNLFDTVLGKKAVKNLNEDDPIDETAIQQ